MSFGIWGIHLFFRFVFTHTYSRYLPKRIKEFGTFPNYLEVEGSGELELKPIGLEVIKLYKILFNSVITNLSIEIGILSHRNFLDFCAVLT